MSCNTKNRETAAQPSVLLSEPQMVEIMMDVQIMENAINYRRGKGMKMYKLKAEGFDAIFSHYGITDSIFIENVNYYNSTPERMKNIMDSVCAHLERMQEELKKK